MQFEYDPEQLIAEVSKRPGIWNHEDPQYRAKNIKSKQWNDIVKELMSINEVTMTKSEMRELELQLQKKWKSLRDCFQKYLVNPNKSKRPYIYSKQLEFLLKDKVLPAQRKKQVVQTGSSDSEDGDSGPKNVWVPKKKIRIQKTEEISDDNGNDNDDYSIEANCTAEVDTRNIQAEGHGPFAFANVEVPPLAKNDSEDTDKMFLMSLLPHLRSIPEEFRLNVKLELMQVLRVANESTAKLKYPYSGLE